MRKCWWGGRVVKSVRGGWILDHWTSENSTNLFPDRGGGKMASARGKRKWRVRSIRRTRWLARDARGAGTDRFYNSPVSAIFPKKQMFPSLVVGIVKVWKVEGDSCQTTADWPLSPLILSFLALTPPSPQQCHLFKKKKQKMCFNYSFVQLKLEGVGREIILQFTPTFKLQVQK